MWVESNLEEVDLDRAVAEVQDDGALCSKPQREVRQPRQLVPFPPRHVGAGLQQVFAHVVTEVLKQRYLIIIKKEMYLVLKFHLSFPKDC